MPLSTEISDARKKAGLTQEQAATQWGIPLSTLRHYEQGKREPRGLALTALRSILASVGAMVIPSTPSSPSTKPKTNTRATSRKSKPST